MSTSVGLGHYAHALINHVVVDHAHGDAVGLVRAYAPDITEPTQDYAITIPNTPPVLWLVPPGGGPEWTTHPDAVEKVTP